ncbi:MAG: RNA-binding protein [Methanospirillum sp.]|nr:RNA-binding protein [Methanospirillum sp.]
MNLKRLFVGNLTYSVDEKQLWGLFSRYGEVVGVRVIEGKGYGFVEMESYEEARNARNALNETEFLGRNLLIDDVRPPRQKTASHHKPGAVERRRRDSPGRSGGMPSKNRSGRNPRESGRNTGMKHPGSRDHEIKTPERVLKNATRPVERTNEKVGGKKPKKPQKKASSSSDPPKKSPSRFWPGGRR